MKLSSLNFKIPAAVALLCLLTAAVVAIISYRGAESALRQAAQEQLELVRHNRTQKLERWFGGAQKDLNVLLRTKIIKDSVTQFTGAWRDMGNSAESRLQNTFQAGQSTVQTTGGVDLSLQRYISAHNQFHPFFEEFMNEAGYYDVFLIDPDGNLVYTVLKEPDYATNLLTGRWADSGLSEVFRNALSAKENVVVLADFSSYGPSNGQAAAFVATQIRGGNGELIGILALQLPNSQISAVANATLGLGATGEVTFIGPDSLRRNGSRFENGPTFGSEVTNQDYLPAALSGETGIAEGVINDRGQPAMVSYGSLEVMGKTWAVTAQMENAEVYESVTELRSAMLQQLSAAIVLVLVVSSLLARSLSRPMTRVGTAMKAIADERYDIEIPAKNRSDEIGDIGRTLADFRDKLVAAAEDSKEVAFKSAAFADSSIAMIIVDRDFEIVYHNISAKDLFGKYSDEMKEFWPDFDPEALLGECIDKFHKDPSHQRAILSDPSNLPYRADITVGSLKFALNVSAIIDKNNEYIGNVLEWVDVGEARLNSGILDAIRRNQLLVEYDLSGRILNANDQFLSIYNYSGDQMNDLRFIDLFSDKSDSNTVWRQVLNGEALNGKTSRLDQAGQPLWMDSSINLVVDAKGKPFKVIEIASDITTAEHSRQKAEAQRLAMVENQDLVVRELRHGLDALANGDLTVSLDKVFAPEYEQLRGDFNNAVAKLLLTIQQLATAAGNIHNGTSEISQAADDLARRTENQAATLEETAAALEQLTESVRSASEGANKADGVVREARENAEDSGQVVLKAVEAMNEIESSSKQISQIIGVIDDIAFQTNLLALNAGVEAARAGEAGRGFAVVASEVRALAQRSSEAAKAIKTLISESSQHVDTGVALVGDAGNALRQIVENVSKISGLVSDLAMSSREQAVGLSEINTGVNHLDQVTQQNAAMVEQSTAASHSMNKDAATLASLVSVFKRGDEDDTSGSVVELPVQNKTEKSYPDRALSQPDTAVNESIQTNNSGWEDF